MGKRIDYIDTAKGFTILLVILGHNEIPSIVNKFIFSFHMPLFFVLSGFFFRPDKLTNIIAKGWKQLLKPYVFTCCCIIVFFILFQTVQYLYSNIPYNLTQLKDFLTSIIVGDIGPVWFLLSLFWAKIYVSFFLRLGSNAFAFILIIATIGFITGNSDFNVFFPFQILSGMIAALYVYIGYEMRRYDVLSINISKFNLIVLSVLLIVSSPTVVLSFTYTFPLKIFNVITSCIITYVVIYNFRILEDYLYINIFANLKRFMVYLGRNTLVILCFHTLEMSFNLWKFLPEMWTPLLILLKLSFLCCVPLITKHVPVVKTIFHNH